MGGRAATLCSTKGQSLFFAEGVDGDLIDPGIEGGAFEGGKGGAEAVVDLVEGEGGGASENKGLDRFTEHVMGMAYADAISDPQSADGLLNLGRTHLLTTDVDHLLDTTCQVDIAIVRDITTITRSHQAVDEGPFIILWIPIAYHGLSPMDTELTIDRLDVNTISDGFADGIEMGSVMELQRGGAVGFGQAVIVADTGVGEHVQHILLGFQ